MEVSVGPTFGVRELIDLLDRTPREQSEGVPPSKPHRTMAMAEDPISVEERESILNVIEDDELKELEAVFESSDQVDHCPGEPEVRAFPDRPKASSPIFLRWFRSNSSALSMRTSSSHTTKREVVCTLSWERNNCAHSVSRRSGRAVTSRFFVRRFLDCCRSRRTGCRSISWSPMQKPRVTCTEPEYTSISCTNLLPVVSRSFR